MTVLSVLRRNRLPKVQPAYRDAFVLSGMALHAFAYSCRWNFEQNPGDGDWQCRRVYCDRLARPTRP